MARVMAIGDEHLEEPTGVVDGANDTFYTSVAYQSGTLRLFFNGQLVRATDDDHGFTESNPTTGEFVMKEPPLPIPLPDTLQVRYLEA